ncbi:MAG TPA: ABC transporter substrate-binding protein [Dermatophilaceae bacterium]|jgi:polar amino acid transport system substrate-binding protein
MNRPNALPLRVAAGLVLALVAAMPAACGDSTTSPSAPSVVAPFNQRLHDLLPQAVRDRGVLRVGTDASYAPMSAFGPDGRTIVGVEPDLGAQIGRVLGVRLQFRNLEFTTLLADVAGGRVDLAMSAMTDTPGRARTADFVNYFRAGTSIVVQRGNPAGVTGINDLCGKVVAVQDGTTQVDLLARSQKNCGERPITVKSYPTNSDALVQLRTGRAVAVLNDLPPAVFLVNDVRTRSHYQLASDVQYEPGPYGIAVAKSQPRLRDAVQGALEELRRSGAYEDVLSRWHVQDGAIQQITINSSR